MLVTIRNGLLELKAIAPKRRWRLIEVNVKMDEVKKYEKDIVSLRSIYTVDGNNIILAQALVQEY